MLTPQDWVLPSVFTSGSKPGRILNAKAHYTFSEFGTIKDSTEDKFHAQATDSLPQGTATKGSGWDLREVRPKAQPLGGSGSDSHVDKPQSTLCPTQVAQNESAITVLGGKHSPSTKERKADEAP